MGYLLLGVFFFKRKFSIFFQRNFLKFFQRIFFLVCIIHMHFHTLVFFFLQNISNTFFFQVCKHVISTIWRSFHCRHQPFGISPSLHPPLRCFTVAFRPLHPSLKCFAATFRLLHSSLKCFAAALGCYTLHSSVLSPFQVATLFTQVFRRHFRLLPSFLLVFDYFIFIALH